MPISLPFVAVMADQMMAAPIAGGDCQNASQIYSLRSAYMLQSAAIAGAAPAAFVKLRAARLAAPLAPTDSA